MRPKIAIVLRASPSGAVIMDLTSRLTSATMSSGPNGYRNFDGRLRLPVMDAFYLNDYPGQPHLSVDYNGTVIWEGRLEDRQLVRDGIRLGAFGYWRALRDIPYTALWSTRRVDGFYSVTEDLNNLMLPAIYQMDTNNRLYIALRKGEVYDTNRRGALTFETPRLSERPVTYVSFDYALAASTDFSGRLTASQRNFGSAAAEWTLAGNGSVQTGSQAITLSTPRARIFFQLFTASGTPITYSGETGDAYLKITNLRVTTSPVPISPRTIQKALIDHIRSYNPNQILATPALIGDSGLDMVEEVYEDRLPADIINYLAALGDTSTPPQLFEAGVFDNRTLQVRQRLGAYRTHWFIDASELDIQQTVETLRNSAYTIYRDESGRTLRTAIETDAISRNRYGIVRQEAIRDNTTSQGRAEGYRSVFVNDLKNVKPRAGIRIRQVYDSLGQRWPVCLIKPWDRVTIRNLPPIASNEIDRLRRFVIRDVTYDPFRDVADIAPELPKPRLELHQQRWDAGVGR